jgi:hypothetical protein
MVQVGWYNEHPISSLVPNLNGEGSRRSSCLSASTYEMAAVQGEAVVQGGGSIGWKQRVHQDRLRGSSRSSQVISGQTRQLLLGRLDSRESQFASMSGLFCRCSCMDTKLFGGCDRGFPES